MKTAIDNELKSDFSLLEGRDASDVEIFESFKESMRGRAYGSEALNTAWNWFRIGWYKSVLSRD